MQHSKPGVIEAGRQWIRDEMSLTDYYAIVARANRPPRKTRKPPREALARLFRGIPEPPADCTCGRRSCLICGGDIDQ